MKRTSTQLKKTTSDSCSSFLRNYIIVLLLVFLGGKAMAQPCTAHRWVAGAHWNADGTINDKPNAPAPLGIIRCGSSAETENSLFNFKGKYHASDFQIVTGAAPCVNPDGGSTTVNNPVENQDIVWMNFDIRPYAGTFQYQITPGGGELGWALYVAGKQPGVNANGLSGNCSSLTYVKCGISATGWVTVEVPSFTEPANYYIAMWRNNGQNLTNQNVTFKGRYGCGEAFCTLEKAATETTVCSTTNYTVKLPLQGSGGTFKVEDLTNDPTGVLAGKATAYVVKTYDVNHVLLNTTSPSSAEPTITFGTYAGGAIFIDVFVTYNEGVAYNLLVKPSTVSTSCTDQVSFSGAAPDCCVPIVVDAGNPTKTVCADNASVSLTGSVTGGSTTGQWTTSGDGSFGNANSLSTTYTPGANDKSGGSVTLTLTSTNNRTCTPGSDNMVVSIVTVTAAAGDDFTKNCSINISGKAIGEANNNTYTYSWTPTTGLSNAAISNPTANPANTTTYTLRKTHITSGCYDDDEITVTVNTPTITAVAGTAFTKDCSQNTSGKAIGEADDNNYSYSWTPTTGLSNAAISNPTANPDITTTYTVRKTHKTSGCYDDDEITVTVNKPTITAAAGDDFIKNCSINVSGKAIGEATNNDYTYSWTPTAGLSNAAISNPTANPATTTTYTVRKTHKTSGCYDDDEITVTVNTTATSFTVCLVQPDLCNQYGSVTFSTAGTSGLNYSIDNGTTFTNTTGIFTNLLSGSVTGFKVRNAAGCVATLNCNAASTCTNNLRLRTEASQSTVQPIIVEEPTKVTAYPNPFTGKVKFVVTSAIAGKGSLEVYNMLGQKVKSVYQGNIIAGNQTFELNLPSSARSNLIYVLTVGDKRITGKLLHLNR